MFGKDWKKVTAHVRTRISAQVRSHAQKVLKDYSPNSQNGDGAEESEFAVEESFSNTNNGLTMKTEDLNCAVEALGVSKQANENGLKNLNRGQKRFRFDAEGNSLATAKYELPNYDGGYPSRAKLPTGQVLGPNGNTMLTNAAMNEEDQGSQAKEGSHPSTRQGLANLLGNQADQAYMLREGQSQVLSSSQSASKKSQLNSSYAIG